MLPGVWLIKQLLKLATTASCTSNVGFVEFTLSDKYLLAFCFFLTIFKWPTSLCVFLKFFSPFLSWEWKLFLSISTLILCWVTQGQLLILVLSRMPQLAGILSQHAYDHHLCCLLLNPLPGAHLRQAEDLLSNPWASIFFL